MRALDNCLWRRLRGGNTFRRRNTLQPFITSKCRTTFFQVEAKESELETPEELLLVLEKAEAENQVLRSRACFSIPHPTGRSWATWPSTGHHGRLRCNRSTIPSQPTPTNRTPPPP